MDASKSKPRTGLEGLPRFLESFTAYHLRVRFVAEPTCLATESLASATNGISRAYTETVDRIGEMDGVS
ncbi:MAG: hypothetical protein Q4A64_03525 [Porphyromonadaceae bacterium]|nr:hypothetical protein [Porphyromonadaceae bacterium]